MTINLSPIVEAVRAVRAHVGYVTAGLAERILAGDTDALDEGRQVAAEVDRLADRLAVYVDNPVHADHLEVEHLIGVAPIIDAVSIAIGEQESDDPDTNERFRPVRLERQRASYERTVRDLRSLDRPLTADEKAWLDQCTHDLDLISVGIEPA